ncbi:hypothetical protein PYCCODRAFT_1481622 [Trametes coccinea BRFM310]|uniref:F-box domain-containing protein n=1 Tax=Trametes coccinea (strain BRFM310) TaxID=1353009 RepID=A0A1Y2IAK7_TRAC3|nr:hypothetical protein PYCCODRAFT_1481622 [Trametes coccinea BRFM310]
MNTNLGSPTIRVLDDDCLQLIFSLLRPGGYLRPLSLTCKRLRETCLNVLFARCMAVVDSLEDPAQCFPPPELWRYVRTLHLSQRFEWRIRRTDSGEVISDPICAELALSEVLHGIPNLTGLIYTDTKEYGIPWRILQILLSIPQLRSFDLFGRLSVSDDAALKPTPNLPPITSFRYVPQDERKGQRSSPSEKRILGVLLAKLAPTLQVLHLPCESVPFRKLDRWDWPCLHEFYLRGDGRRLARAGSPLILLLRRMQCLRRLSLKLARCQGQRPLGAIWPPGCTDAVMPWPELESLTLSWIDPQEQLFGHLPATLRELRLRVWPRHYYLYLRPTWTFSEGGQPAAPSWAFDLPSPSSLMRAIQECQVSTLECLELEYEVDENNIPMLRSIAQSFPRLRSLQLYPYRSEEDFSAVPSENMSKALSPLQDLQTLRLFLDFFHLKESDHMLSKVPDVAAFVDNLSFSALRHFARRLTPSLRSIHILLVSDETYTWEKFGIARDAAGNTTVYRRDTYVPTHNIIGIADCE